MSTTAPTASGGSTESRSLCARTPTLGGSLETVGGTLYTRALPFATGSDHESN